MKRILSSISALVAAALVAAACGFEHNANVLAPSPVIPGGNSGGNPAASTPPSVIGTWVSQTPELPSPSSCKTFQWEITSQTANSIAGHFSATCGGSLLIEGSGTGQLNGNSVPLSVSGKATLPGIPSCDFSVSGSGTIDGNTLTIPYSGTTCLGPVRGTQVLRKHTDPPPASAPTPDPTPAPSPADPLLGCGPLASGDKQKLVECLHDRVNPPHTPEGAFEVTKRVAWALRGEGGGLLIKNAGENIVSWHGYSFAAARICYPDGHIFKVLSDVPATNGPIWLDNDYVDRKLYVPAIDPNS